MLPLNCMLLENGNSGIAYSELFPNRLHRSGTAYFSALLCVNYSSAHAVKPTPVQTATTRLFMLALCERANFTLNKKIL